MTDATMLRAIAALHAVTRWLPRPVREWLWWRVWYSSEILGYGLGDRVWLEVLRRVSDATDWGPPCDGDDSGEPF